MSHDHHLHSSLPPHNTVGQDAGDPEKVVLGLDIGGSKVHGALWEGASFIAEARVGSANLQNVGADEAAANLRDLFRELRSKSRTTVIDTVVAGSGGVDTSVNAERLRALITPHAPHAVIEVVHDTRLILAASGATTGISVIAGTGSVAWDVRGPLLGTAVAVLCATGLLIFVNTVR